MSQELTDWSHTEQLALATIGSFVSVGEEEFTVECRLHTSSALAKPIDVGSSPLPRNRLPLHAQCGVGDAFNAHSWAGPTQLVCLETRWHPRTLRPFCCITIQNPSWQRPLKKVTGRWRWVAMGGFLVSCGSTRCPCARTLGDG